MGQWFFSDPGEIWSFQIYCCFFVFEFRFAAKNVADYIDLPFAVAEKVTYILLNIYTLAKRYIAYVYDCCIPKAKS